jgi:hypothetical protein
VFDWIEDVHLALIFAGRQGAEVDVEAERNYTQPAFGLGCCGDGGCLEGFFLILVKADEGD